MSALEIATAGGRRAVDLDAALDPAMAEHAEVEANRWIKGLRLAEVDGRTLRDRFTYRGDSLWWFAEIYLHRMRAVSRAHRVVAALERLAAEDPTARWFLTGADGVVGNAAHAVAARRGIAIEGPADRGRRARGLGTHTKALFHTAAAMADRLRPNATAAPRRGVRVAAFVHSAFAGASQDDEAYVGPVIRALQARLPVEAIGVVGLGPRTNFRVRRWRDRMREFADPAASGLAAVPVTAYAGWQALASSRGVWAARESTYAALAGSRDLRERAAIGGYDLWPLVLEQVRGIADLQFPWSARAMDEAGAALDALEPRSVVTYAEAGGWGRALMLEARRRGIATIALQHGFIYRHWLNYLHEADEMRPSEANPDDRGFPRPDCTLLFDAFTREHLEREGRFPHDSLHVTGSPRLDAIVAAARASDDGARAALRTALGAEGTTPIAVVVAKFAQLGAAFHALVDAARSMPDARVVVKPHPAEGAEPYIAASHGAPNVVIAPAGVELGALLSVASVLVTANSTAAIEAMPLGVPALVVALPNNLSPFVDAGVMAGAGTPAAVLPALKALLYDREMRQRLAEAQRVFAARYGLEADGGAADRAADAIVALTRT